MKASVFGIFSLVFFAVAQVIASPLAAEVNTQLIKRQEVEDVDVILATLIMDVQTTDAKYNSTCSGSCTTTHITSWCKEVADHCYRAISKCKKLPHGHTFPDRSKCVGLVVKLLLEIQSTLKFLLKNTGLLGIIIGIVNLVAVLITALNALLIQLAIFVDGLLVAVTSLLFSIVGNVGCLLCTLGLGLLV